MDDGTARSVAGCLFMIVPCPFEDDRATGLEC